MRVTCEANIHHSMSYTCNIITSIIISNYTTTEKIIKQKKIHSIEY